MACAVLRVPDLLEIGWQELACRRSSCYSILRSRSFTCKQQNPQKNNTASLESREVKQPPSQGGFTWGTDSWLGRESQPTRSCPIKQQDSGPLGPSPRCAWQPHNKSTKRPPPQSFSQHRNLENATSSSHLSSQQNQPPPTSLPELSLANETSNVNLDSRPDVRGLRDVSPHLPLPARILGRNPRRGRARLSPTDLCRQDRSRT